MSDDPRLNAAPGNEIDPHTGHREIDPFTGYDTTGHDWNGIKELNTAFPRVVIWALVLAFAYSVVAWVLLPAWPLGRSFTPGILGLDQGDMAVERLRAIDSSRESWLDPFASGDFESLDEDEALTARAMPAAERLFQDNCAACHGENGGGGPGFPVLTDAYWLWGGDQETLAETLRYGINSSDPDTRWAEMPAFDWMDRGERIALAEYVSALRDGTADHDSAAAASFEENCAACHGDGGEGGLLNGAPSLSDESVIYGQDAETVMQTLRHGRSGVMPAWSGRLTEAEINLLAHYIARLAPASAEPSQ